MENFLKSKGYDAISPKGISNGKLVLLSKSEQRILVTNDSDFTDSVPYPKGKIFSLVWLRIPQNNPKALLKSFSMLLKDKTKSDDFKENFIVLNENNFEVKPIPSSETLTK